LFRGIQPTSDQRSQLEAIQGKYRPQMKSILDQMRPAMQEARSARQRGDTTAARTAFERTKGEREKLQALRKQELADVRSVLTPDQRQQFDKNLSDMQNRAGKRRGGKGAGVSGE
jgi:Spy/CpxP family protein refolding chaperone